MYGRIATAVLLLSSGMTHAAVPQYGTDVPYTPCKGAICIQVTLGDHKPHTFLLDTSYNHSSIDESVARTLSWKLTPYSSKGQVVAGLFLADAPKPVAFAGIAGSAEFLVESKDPKEAPTPWEGTLDYTFFKDRVLQIDYKHHVIRVSQLLKPEQHPKPGKGVLKLVNFHDWGPPIVVGGPFTVDGKSLEAQIDTSYTGSLLIFSGAEKSFGFDALASKGTLRNFPITDGGVDMLGAQADSTGFGDRILAKPAMVYFPTPKVHQPYQERFQGTVGNEFFAGTVLTLDFHDMTLDVTPAG
jgi:hypothetical protein